MVAGLLEKLRYTRHTMPVLPSSQLHIFDIHSADPLLVHSVVHLNTQHVAFTHKARVQAKQTSDSKGNNLKPTCLEAMREQQNQARGNTERKERGREEERKEKREEKREEERKEKEQTLLMILLHVTVLVVLPREILVALLALETFPAPVLVVGADSPMSRLLFGQAAWAPTRRVIGVRCARGLAEGLTGGLG